MLFIKNDDKTKFWLWFDLGFLKLNTVIRIARLFFSATIWRSFVLPEAVSGNFFNIEKFLLKSGLIHKWCETANKLY